MATPLAQEYKKKLGVPMIASTLLAMRLYLSMMATPLAQEYKKKLGVPSWSSVWSSLSGMTPFIKSSLGPAKRARSSSVQRVSKEYDPPSSAGPSVNLAFDFLMAPTIIGDASTKRTWCPRSQSSEVSAKSGFVWPAASKTQQANLVIFWSVSIVSFRSLV